MKQASKVASITLLFWILKIIATTLGETLGDFFSMALNFGYLATLIGVFVFFIIVLLVQLYSKQYIPVCFWLVIVSTTTLGTEISDFIDRSLHLGYSTGSLLLFLCLITTLLLWKVKFNSIQVFPIYNRNKEIYYWLAVLFSNSLGTAFGDWLGVIGFNYSTGAFITGAIIIAVCLLHYFTRINSITLFWIAFVFTRPFGATFGDLLTKPLSKGGLGFGTLYASLVCLCLMAVFIIIEHNKSMKYKVYTINH